MDIGPQLENLVQPTLFELGGVTSGAIELFPTVWSAAENLTSSEAAVRRAGLETLAELNAVRLSPLVAYLVSTRLTDPDLALRARATRALAQVFRPDHQGQPAPDAVRQCLRTYLGQIRSRKIYAMLQMVDAVPDSEEDVAVLLNHSTEAGVYLAEILADRSAPICIRRQAVQFIGRVGFVNATPTLERMAEKLENRLNGQQAMPFAPRDENDEVELLPAVKDALARLSAP